MFKIRPQHRGVSCSNIVVSLTSRRPTFKDLASPASRCLVIVRTFAPNIEVSHVQNLSPTSRCLIVRNFGSLAPRRLMFKNCCVPHIEAAHLQRSGVPNVEVLHRQIFSPQHLLHRGVSCSKTLPQHRGASCSKLVVPNIEACHFEFFCVPNIGASHLQSFVSLTSRRLTFKVFQFLPHI